MNLNVDEWKLFKVGDLFDIHPTKAIEGVTSEECVEGGQTPLVVNQSYNNGITGKCNYEATEKGGIITFSDTWEGETFFYQKDDFIGFAHVQGMYPKQEMSENSLIFISVMLEYEARDRYSYGRKKRRDLIKKSYVKLPADSKGKPDWKFMDEYVKSLHHNPLTTKKKKEKSLDLNRQSWKEYRFGDLISDIYKAKAINKDDLTVATDSENSIRYITRTGDNNGCELLADIREIDNNLIEKANAISIGDTTATSFYQNEDFITGDHMVVVRADSWLNKYTALYVLTILNNEQYKYSYGRAFLMDRIKDTLVKLPADANGNPDWQFMENYIKALPYGDRLEA